MLRLSYLSESLSNALPSRIINTNTDAAITSAETPISSPDTAVRLTAISVCIDHTLLNNFRTYTVLATG